MVGELGDNKECVDDWQTEGLGVLSLWLVSRLCVWLSEKDWCMIGSLAGWLISLKYCVQSDWLAAALL